VFLISDSRDSEAGVGIIEVAIVVTVVATIAAMSLILFGRAAARYRLNQKAHMIAWQIERARSLAVKYNQTLTLDFTSQNKVLGLSCSDCDEAKTELAALNLSNDVTLSTHPTIKLKGNGTITSTSGKIVVSDGSGRHAEITIAGVGRTLVGSVID
jgi:Tfp pilus assembly protein FimT